MKQSKLDGMVNCKNGMHMGVIKIDITAPPCVGSAALEDSLYDHLTAMALKIGAVIELERNLESGFVQCFANGHKFTRVNSKDNK